MQAFFQQSFLKWSSGPTILDLALLAFHLCTVMGLSSACHVEIVGIGPRLLIYKGSDLSNKLHPENFKQEIDPVQDSLCI